MAFTYGFYNSLNHDRVYDAIQLSQIFDGVLNDGVFQGFGNAFNVIPGTGMQVIVQTGRAWFNHTWSLNDSDLVLEVSESEATLTRVDLVVLEINEDNRENSIKVISGNSALTSGLVTLAYPPELVNTATIHQYPIANIVVQPGSSSISANDITYRVGDDSGECPYAEVATGNSVEVATNQIYEQVRTWLGNGTVSKLGTSTVGSATKPIYWDSGKPKAFNSTLGSGTKPVYLNSGTVTPFSSTVGGDSQPLYLKSGALTAGKEYVPKAGGTFSGDISINDQSGTATSLGVSSLSLGNSTKSGVAGNAYGQLRFYGKDDHSVYIRPASDGITADRVQYLPDKGGTFALTSDIPARSLSLSATNSQISATSTAKKINGVTSLPKGLYLFLAHQFVPGYTAARDCRLILHKLKTGGYDEIAVVRGDTYATGTSSGFTLHLSHIVEITATTSFDLYFSCAYAHTTNVDPRISYMQVLKLA